MVVTRVDTQRQATGIVFGIVDSAGRRIISYGTMGTDDDRPVAGDTVFDIGSITKVFTALLLSDMVQRGEVALESAGGLRSTANDLVTLLEAMLGYRESSLQAAMRAMTTTTRPGGMQPSTDIGLAWNVHRTAGHAIAWKNGSVGGFRAFIGFDPQRRIGVVALANAQTALGVDDIGLHVLDRNIPVDLRAPTVRREVAVDPAILERYVGRYRFSPTDIVTITREGDRLFMQQPGQDRIPLFAYGDREFFLKIVDAQVTFEVDSEGPATAATWHQSGQAERCPRVE